MQPDNPFTSSLPTPPASPPGPTPMQPLEPETSVDPKSEGIKSIISTLALLLIAPLIALSLTAFVFQSYEVEGPSMETTLQDNDRLVILKLPRTWARLTRHPYIPDRGDIIIFVKKDTYEFAQNKNKQLIKRVIALPGEQVVVRDGVLTVFNKEHPGGFQPDKELAYGHVIKETSGNLDLTVPTGEVFVAGDNRENSLDSRVFGTVPAEDIVGKLGLRILPLDKAGSF